ncbi:MAG: hypothetical protein JSU87_11645 [Gemmatimonadota bacterium]|nr:MAG: hypothetical protein JSU87_11645 [Gemmatimonadota bacterium]
MRNLELSGRALRLVGVCWVAAVGTVCGSNPEEPGDDDPQLAKDVYIEVQVAGGLAGADFSYAIDGSTGVVRGLACQQACDFDPGDILLHLSPVQIIELSELFRRAGIHDYAGRDFGTKCCDQFHYRIVYRDGDGESTVTGSSEALPDGLRLAVARLDLLVQGIAPIIIDFDSQPDAWPRDPLVLSDYSLSGHILHLAVEYGGGCEVHELDLVAWGGWLESFPVQVNVLLTHEGNDDPCDAVIHEDKHFDLTPLREAYGESYGVAASGSTALILRLTVPDGNGPRLITYNF